MAGQVDRLRFQLRTLPPAPAIPAVDSVSARVDHGNSQWRKIRDTSPSEWEDVVEFDAAILKGIARANATGNTLLGEAFLHRSRVPLGEAPIDHVTRAERAALDDAEAEAAELGVVNGCSPWSCRGDAEQDDFGLAS